MNKIIFSVGLNESTQDLMGNKPYSSANLTKTKCYSVNFSKTELGLIEFVFIIPIKNSYYTTEIGMFDDVKPQP